MYALISIVEIYAVEKKAATATISKNEWSK
jgi:hypothetical protein